MAREPEKSARETGKAKTEANAASKNAGNGENTEAKSAVEMLKEQHRELQATLAKRSETNTDRNAIVKEFAAAWLPHLAVEQEILAPALSQAGIDEEKLSAAAIQKDIINLLLADLLRGDNREFGQAKLEALARQLNAHVEGASAEVTRMFAIVSAAEKSRPGLHAQMKARYDRLKSRFANTDESIGEAMVLLAPRSLSVPSNSRQNRREHEMSSRYSNMRERDDQGRFMSDDERGYFRGAPERDDNGRFTSDNGRSRGRFQGGEQHYGPRSLGSMGRDRDEEGRFVSEGGPRSRGRYDDEDERYSRRSMGRERDDDGRYSSEGRGTGGWFGDSEGHSEASRRGWERGSHGESGWYGDSEGHSQASRRGWDSPRHGESGWYGDSEGHSEASRRGWEGREGGRSPRYDERSQRYDEMQSRSRSRYDDDRDYRRSDDYDRGNGGRGWSGDPEGHSEASRRGWQNRR
jgi:hypothetical protein